MRIAINTRFLLPGKLEGLGWYTHELVRRMVLQHPEVTFYFLFDRPFDPGFVYANNVVPMVLYPPARHPLLWYAWFEWAVPRALRRSGAEVFFSPDNYLSLRAPTPTVMTVHDLIPLQQPEQIPWAPRRYYQSFLPRYLKRADKLVAISGFVQQAVVREAGIPDEKVSVVYNGCRDGFRPLPASEQQAVRALFSDGQPYFFYAGAIHPRKNIPRLIRAFDAFKKRSGAPVKLLLAGRFAWQTGAVTDAWRASGSQEDIRFLGYVPDAQLPGLVASALALTYVSLSEGFGLPLLEAMHCDTPVLCANATALPEVAGDAALLVDPYAETAIADGLEALYADPALRQRLIEKGRQQRLKFDWDAAAGQVYRLLQDVAAQPST